MLLRLHLPSFLDMPGASLQQQRQLRQVIAQSFERAVKVLDLPSVQIELVQAEDGDDAEHIRSTGLPAITMYREEGGSFVHAGESHYSEPVQTEDGGDVEHIRSTGLPAITVYREEGGSFVHAGESHYKEAKSLAQAVEQGTALFARSGYAVLRAEAADRFYVLQFNIDEQTSFGSQAGQMVHLGERVHLVGMADSAPEKHVVVAVAERKGQASFKKQEDQQVMNPVAARGASIGDQGGMLDFIVLMDRSLFAEMPWEKRVEYLLLLLRAWTGAREERALLELMLSTRTGAELEAFFALLRLQGKHWLLFQELNKRNYSLLKLLAEFVDDESPDWRSLVSLLLDTKMLSDTPLPAQQGPSQKLPEAARMLSAWLQENLEASGTRLRSPTYVLGNLGMTRVAQTDLYERLDEAPLAEFLWVVELARQGNMWAQKLVSRMILQAGASSMDALSGLQYMEKLTQTAAIEDDNQRSKETGPGARLRRQLRALFIFDLLTWLTEHDVVVPTHQDVEGQLQRLATLVDAPGAWQLPEINTAGIESDYSERLQRCMSAAGEMTTQANKGLRVLLQCSAWDQAAVLDLIENIAPDRLHAFLRTIPFVSPSSLERWDASLLKELAAHPGALVFIREAGYDLLHGALTRRGSSWKALDRFLHKLAMKRETIGNALDYRWFLYRMEKGEDAAFAEVDAIELHEDQPEGGRDTQ